MIFRNILLKRKGDEKMGYSSEKNTQIVISLLKYHGIRKIVASPGATNVSFVASVQQDDFLKYILL